MEWSDETLKGANMRKKLTSSGTLFEKRIDTLKNPADMIITSDTVSVYL
jgi:hypothetical protein